MKSQIAFTLALVVLFSAATITHAQDSLDDETGASKFDACEAVRTGSVFKPLGEIHATIKDDGLRLPPDCSSLHFTSQKSGSEPRFLTDLEYHWAPTNFFHMPTYFDDVPLERYGQSKYPFLQPVISGTKFVLQVPAVPYKMGIDRPHACITTLGHRPPGDCVPCIRQRLPKELDASFLEAAATVGLVFLLP